MTFPKALKHGAIRELFPDVFFVTGCMNMAPLMSFSRNMTIVREGERLVLINSVRLGDAGLAELDALGKVTDVLSIAGFHGRDDAFYKDHYGARVWDLQGHIYAKGVKTDVKPSDAYFHADEQMGPETTLPLAGAKLHCFQTQAAPEALLHLERGPGIVVAGDSLQNWAEPDAYFSLAGKLMMRGMGFFKEHNLGPGWVKGAKPERASVRGVLDMEFDHLLPAHGAEVMGDAREKFRPSIEAFAA